MFAVLTKIAQNCVENARKCFKECLRAFLSVEKALEQMFTDHRDTKMG
jgi:hypothetical protein